MQIIDIEHMLKQQQKDIDMLKAQLSTLLDALIDANSLLDLQENNNA